MATKRFRIADLKTLASADRLPLAKGLISDTISETRNHNDYGEPIGNPYAVWEYSDDCEPVTITEFYVALVDRLEEVARDDPAYFRKQAPMRSLEDLRASIRRRAARNRAAGLVARAEKAYRVGYRA